MSASHRLALGGLDICGRGGGHSSDIWSTEFVHSFWKCGQPPSSHLSDIRFVTSVTTWMAPLSEEPSADSEGWTIFQKITLVKGSDFSCWNELCARVISLMEMNGFIFEVCDRGISWKGFSWCTDNYPFCTYRVFLRGDFLIFIFSFLILC